MSAAGAFLGAIVLALIAGIGIFILITVAGAFFRLLGRFFSHIGRFIGGEIRDIFRFVGAVIVAPVFAFLTLASVVVGRWSASAHYARALRDEVKSAALCVYRVLVGHPLRLIGLGTVMEGYEHRLPQVVAQAPTRDTPRGGRKARFGGYNIIGSLPGGGSGGRLYIAEPDAVKRAALARAGNDVDRVVIKTFSLHEGSSLPQMLRESRALEAAKQLGLVLEHELADDERFYYVMRYVPGDSLAEVTRRIHADAAPEGLGNRAIRELVGYVADLARTLEHYHSGGLWHKDVKPDNIIVHDGRAELVDLGLITPLRSAMTLTTHGTEYFRDPELVRMALRGVKVHEVNGAKFDIYAVGAVLYSLIENSFPAHGGLSQVSKRCPDAIRWVIRRAMTDYDKRYADVGELLADLRVILASEDLFEVKPAVLPSRKGAEGAGGESADLENEEPGRVVSPESAFASSGSPVPPIPPHPPRPERAYDEVTNEPSRPRPTLRVVNWWTGRYAADRGRDGARPGEPVAVAAEAFVNPRAGGPRRDARQQVADARRRATERRHRATTRIAGSRSVNDRRFRPEIFVAIAIGVFVMLYLVRADRLGTDGASDFAAPIAELKAGLASALDDGDGEQSLADLAVRPTLFLASTLGEVSDEQAREAIASLARDARRANLEVRGLLDETYYPEGVRAPADFAQDTELLAELQLLVAGRPIEADDVYADVMGWMNERNEIDALAWLEWRGNDRTSKDVLVVTFTASARFATPLAQIESREVRDLARELHGRAKASPPPTPALPAYRDGQRQASATSRPPSDATDVDHDRPDSRDDEHD